jgi:GNAT superfamily N-acetyltransferase
MVTREEIFALLSQQLLCPNIPQNRFYSILLQLPRNHLVFVYRDDAGKLVGMVTLWIEQKLSHGGHCVGHVTDLVVDRDSVSTVVERLLIEHCIAEAGLHDCCRLIIHANETLAPLCRRLGFRSHGRSFTRAIKPNDQ